MNTAFSFCTILLVINLMSPSSAIGDSENRIPRRRHSSINGETLFQKLCADCHGTDGRGSESASLLSPPIIDIVTPPYPRSADRDAVIRIIRDGLGSSMLSYGSRLSDSQIHALAEYLTQLRNQ